MNSNETVDYDNSALRCEQSSPLLPYRSITEIVASIQLQQQKQQRDQLQLQKLQKLHQKQQHQKQKRQQQKLQKKHQTKQKISSTANLQQALPREDCIIPKIDFSEITLDTQPLGKGGFSVVSIIQAIELNDDAETQEVAEYQDGDDVDAASGATEKIGTNTTTTTTTSPSLDTMKKAREQLANRVSEGKMHSNTRGHSHSSKDTANQQQPEYVVKILRKDLSSIDRRKGVEDLALEAEFLNPSNNYCNHRNILQLRGISTASARSSDSSFFLIFDKLESTLEQRMNVWRGVAQSTNGVHVPYYGQYCFSESTRNELHINWCDRIQAACEVISAIQHLHSHHIIYRDLKPDNIGFDNAGVVKLFDFGLAKKVDTANVARLDSINDRYNLTGNTGSLRYMAPEVAMNIVYGYSVDVFSFGILFWQICSLQTPFAKLNQRSHDEKVVRGGLRPKPNTALWPQSWVNLMEQCWDNVPNRRPTSSDIYETISKQMLPDLQNCIRVRGGGLPNEKKSVNKIMGKKTTAILSTEGEGGSSTEYDTTTRSNTTAEEPTTESSTSRIDDDAIFTGNDGRKKWLFSCTKALHAVDTSSPIC